MKTIGIIRERGQLTIPDSIRKLARWTSTSSVVTISIESPQEIILTPHQALNEGQWVRLVDAIKKARVIKGKGGISASKYIARDREAH